jgi:hypothetical protein
VMVGRLIVMLGGEMMMLDRLFHLRH